MRRVASLFAAVIMLSLLLTTGSVLTTYAAACSSTDSQACECPAGSNPLSCACQGSGSGASVCSADGSKDPIDGPDGVLKKVTLIIATIAGIAAVVIIIISGLRFVTANGDSQKIASARNAIIGALVGLVIIAAAASIITFVIGKI